MLKNEPFAGFKPSFGILDRVNFNTSEHRAVYAYGHNFSGFNRRTCYCLLQSGIIRRRPSGPPHCCQLLSGFTSLFSETPLSTFFCGSSSTPCRIDMSWDLHWIRSALHDILSRLLLVVVIVWPGIYQCKCT